MGPDHRKEGRAVRKSRHQVLVVRSSFGERSELVGCEELAKFLQSTHYDRLTLYGIWSKGIASRPKRSATGKKYKGGRYGRNRRSTACSRSPVGQ